MPTTTGKATDLITFSRGTLATVTDADGKIKWAPHNLLLASEQFDASAWTKLGTTVGANNVVAPNGTTTADTITEGAGSGNKSVFPASPPSIVSGQNYTASVFLKAGTRRYVQVSVGPIFGTSQENFGVIVDTSLTPMTIVTTGNGTSGTYVSSSISAVSNGFYLVSVTGNVASTLGYLSISGTDSTTYSITPSSSGSQTFIAWGASLTRADLGGMQANASAYPMYNPSTPRNLLGYSEDWSNAAWIKTNILAFGSGSVANAIAAPNGSLTADKIVESTANDVHVVRQDVTIVSGRNTFSVYLRAAERTRAIVTMTDNSSGDASIGIDLSTGLTFATGIAAGSWTSVSSSVVSAGDGWYRVQITGTRGAGTQTAPRVFLVQSGTTISYTGDGVSGIYLWGAQLSDSASLDTYVPNFGAAPSAAAAHGPRLDYRNGSALGLLVEETRTNLAVNSQTLGSLFTYQSGLAYAVTSEIAPDGTTTANSAIPPSGSQSPIGARLGMTFSAVSYTLSVYAKAFGYNYLSLGLYDDVSSYHTWFNLNNGTVGTSHSGNIGAIIAVGNGWYRCSITRSLGATSTGQIRMYVVNADNTTSITANGTSGILVWGAQLEAGSFATSYIPTAAATVTRNADVASVGVSQFPYSASEGTLVVSATVFGLNKSTSDGLVALTGGSAAENIAIFRNGSANNIASAIRDNNSDQATYVVAMGSQPIKAAIAYAENNSNFALNGTAQTTDTTCTMPTVNELLIGSVYSKGDFPTNGWIRQITYLPRRITNTELAARTA